MEIVYSYLFRKLRYCWYWLKRKKGKVKKMWDRFKWCLIGGFAYIPNTGIAYGVMFVGLALIPIGFKFLSLALGHNVGDLNELGPLPGNTQIRFRSYRYRISDGRKNDER